MKKRHLYIVMAVLAAIVMACDQPIQTPKPAPPAPEEVDMSLETLELYDDVDMATPLTLASPINNTMNYATANAGAQVIYVVVASGYPDKTKIKVNSGYITDIRPGLPASDPNVQGIRLGSQTGIVISVVVRISATNESKEYRISVLKNPADIPTELQDLQTSPIGRKPVYWNGTTLPLDTDGTPLEVAGFDSIDEVITAISTTGAGTEATPDLVMLGDSIALSDSITIPAGKHVKIVTPPYRMYTISRATNGTDPYKGEFFSGLIANTSLTLGGSDVSSTEDPVIDSMLVLDGGAVWLGAASYPVPNVTNNGIQADKSLVEVRGGTLNLGKWVTLQNNGTTTRGAAVAITGGVLNMEDGAKISKNRGGGGANAGGGVVDVNALTGGTVVPGIANIKGGSFEYNMSTYEAGAIYMHHADCELTISGGSFYHNYSGAGGAIRVRAGKLTIANPQTLEKIADSEAVDPVNWAAAQNAMPYSSTGDAAGIEAYKRKIASEGFVLFKHNTASGEGGAINITNEEAAYSPFIADAVFEDNTATNGGGIRASPKIAYAITNSLFRKNNITGGGGGLCLFASNSATDTGEALIENCVFTENKANGNGGGLWTARIRTRVSGSVFTKNEINGAGGGLFLNANNTSALPSVTMVENCAIEENASNWGGGLFYESASGNGTNLITGTAQNPTTIRKNRAQYGGGGLNYKATGPLVMDYTEIRGNEQYAPQATAGQGGGGMRYESAATSTFKKTVVMAGNVARSTYGAGGGGGIIHVYSDGRIVWYGTIGGSAPADSNYAQVGGGVALINGSKFTLARDLSDTGPTGEGTGVIQGNGVLPPPFAAGSDGRTTTQYGGGISAVATGNFQQNVDIQGEVRGNKATTGGGGIHSNITGNSGKVAITLSEGAKITGNSVDVDDPLADPPTGSQGGGGIHFMRANTSSTLALLVMEAGSEISGNAARLGGGVLIHQVYLAGTVPSAVTSGFFMKGGLIKDNTARGTGNNLALYNSLTAGGGVFIWGNASTMVMTGGTIQGNKALGYKGVGGGVFV
ncbi:MAG: hypothetical protein LBC72_00275, partial [Spirochaetaceae bacterium]|nr:hypothetical protein [Spirochaetaceae bacterium]